MKPTTAMLIILALFILSPPLFNTSAVNSSAVAAWTPVPTPYRSPTPLPTNTPNIPPTATPMPPTKTPTRTPTIPVGTTATSTPAIIPTMNPVCPTWTPTPVSATGVWYKKYSLTIECEPPTVTCKPFTLAISVDNPTKSIKVTVKPIQ